MTRGVTFNVVNRGVIFQLGHYLMLQGSEDMTSCCADMFKFTIKTSINH